MSFLSKPVTWGWYLGLVALTLAFNLAAAASRNNRQDMR